MSAATNQTPPAVTLPDDLSYEDATQQLAEVLDALAEGDLSLDDSLALYERGVALAAFCARKLDEADLRVRQWQPDGQLTTFKEWREE